MSDEQQEGALVPEQPVPEEPEARLAWVTARWGSLSENHF